MRKVFKNCYEMDERCYSEYGLTEDILMEHAAEGIESYIAYNLPEASSILIICGPGNNGADGIALARQMQFAFTSVKLHIPFGTKSKMAELQLKRVKKLDYIAIVDEVCDADVIVDALFGAGLDRELDEKSQDLIDIINDLNGFKIACDIPTGINETGQVQSVAFCADTTITMGARKECLYSDAAKEMVGEIVRIDLGLRYNYYTKDIPLSTFLLFKEDIEIPSRDLTKATHKGSFGHAVVFCGEKEGAAVIAAEAASRFGAGLTTLISHENISPPAHLMNATELPYSTTAMAIGMGLGGFLDSDFLQKRVVDSHLPIVLDADGFYEAQLLEILEQKDREIVLTPHPREFTVLWRAVYGEEISTEDVQSDRFGMVRAFGKTYPHITLLLKGANMLISQNNRILINPYGTTKLSKGGSGDVLSGLIVALLAQGHSGIDAAIQGSLALTQAAENYGGASYSMLPQDIICEVTKLEHMSI
ncbi:MAG: NAD(P)H-hydrate dehydratase [Sulfurovum sp.]|nr:NAD(P)H-hydrate dehydratase [Sulfurovum sp.]